MVVAVVAEEEGHLRHIDGIREKVEQWFSTK